MKAELETLVENSEPFPIISTRMLYDAPPIEYLIDEILPTHTICGLTGAPGTGKSWLAFEMMRATVTGTPFLGHFPARQAPALYIGSDASLLDYAQMWRRLTKEAYDSYAEINVENPFDQYAHFMIQSDFDLDHLDQAARLIRTSMRVERPASTERILTEDGWEEIEREGRHYGLIIYDTLTKMTRTPENDNVGRDIVFNHLRDIAEATGATLIVLHHPPQQSEFRTGEEFRGAGSQLGDLDNHFHILRDNGRPNVIVFKVKKFRGITPKPFLFNLDVFDSENDADLSYLDASPDLTDLDADLLDRLITVLQLRNGEPATITDLAIGVMQDSEMNDQYHGNVKRMKNRIRNYLRAAIKLPHYPLAKITNGKSVRGGRADLYSLAYKEISSDKAESTGTDSDGA